MSILQPGDRCTMIAFKSLDGIKTQRHGSCKPAQYSRRNMRHNVVLKAVVSIQKSTVTLEVTKTPVDIATIVAMTLEPSTTSVGERHQKQIQWVKKRMLLTLVRVVRWNS